MIEKNIYPQSLLDGALKRKTSCCSRRASSFFLSLLKYSKRNKVRNCAFVNMYLKIIKYIQLRKNRICNCNLRLNQIDICATMFPHLCNRIPMHMYNIIQIHTRRRGIKYYDIDPCKWIIFRTAECRSLTVAR